MAPIQVIESTDPITGLIRFEQSPVYEMMASLTVLLEPRRFGDWARQAQTHLSDAFMDELRELYEPYGNGMLYIELPVDYEDHQDVPGFIAHVRHMDPVHFVFYLVGRILPPEQIAATHFDADTLSALLVDVADQYNCMCGRVPMDAILADVPAFQHRLADLWQLYWEDFFRREIKALIPHWERGVEDKQRLMDRDGGQELYAKVTGKGDHMPTLPSDYPVTEIVFIPIHFAASSVLMLYGYGNITVLFDAARTEARLAEIERGKERALAALKGLGDSSRLEILRLIAHHGSRMNGKAIAEKLQLSAPTVSRHLTQLKEAGIIEEESTDNRAITYRLNRAAITTLPEMVLEYLES